MVHVVEPALALRLTGMPVLKTPASAAELRLGTFSRCQHEMGLPACTARQKRHANPGSAGFLRLDRRRSDEFFLKLEARGFEGPVETGTTNIHCTNLRPE